VHGCKCSTCAQDNRSCTSVQVYMFSTGVQGISSSTDVHGTGVLGFSCSTGVQDTGLVQGSMCTGVVQGYWGRRILQKYNG